MFKLYCEDKEYDMIEAQIHQEPQYPQYTSSAYFSSTVYSTFSITHMILKLIDDNADFFEELKDKLTQDIL